jgi:hypothetical protein
LSVVLAVLGFEREGPHELVGALSIGPNPISVCGRLLNGFFCFPESTLKNGSNIDSLQQPPEL